MPDLGSLIVQMEEIGARLVAADDERQHFHNTYLRTTRAVKDEIDRGGFLDPEWTERWDLVFAQLYLDAFAAAEGGQVPPGPWQVAFTAAIDPARTRRGLSISRMWSPGGVPSPRCKVRPPSLWATPRPRSDKRRASPAKSESSSSSPNRNLGGGNENGDDGTLLPPGSGCV